MKFTKGQLIAIRNKSAAGVAIRHDRCQLRTGGTCLSRWWRYSVIDSSARRRL